MPFKLSHAMQAAEEGSLGAGALLGIAVPLLQQVIVEGERLLMHVTST